MLIQRILLLLGLIWSLILPVFGAGTDATSVLILGDSITEGYGVSKEEAYPSVLEGLIKNDSKIHHPVKIINAGIGGSTSASGLSRLKWHLKEKPEILILALGANDGLRGLKPAETRKNLLAVIQLAQENKIRVVIAGMKAPPNYGPEYTREFDRMYPELARSTKTALMPFLLNGVAGEKKLNQPDGIHPNEAGHRIIARNVLKILEPLL